ncbi:AraC family transcriptional regulator [Paludibacterium sp. B53371]|uniref:helix-turn-helix domain-containing protein n=1 Tax=Paludibacterium sp. B53371 TaxID=2806263 RepID=UPI001C03D86E|nr:helix-turn-helix domain-containing protein [Paludibacterium sp. B53371]
MASLPLPFVLALLQILVLLRLWLGRRHEAVNPAVLWFIAACALSSVMVGWRWSTASVLVWHWRSMVAATLPPLAWVAFAAPERPRWLHGIPVLLIAFQAWFWRPLLDASLALQFSAYGLALLWLATKGEFAGVRLESTRQAQGLASLAGGMLLISGLTDLVLALDFGFAHGEHALRVVSAANLLMLLLSSGLMLMLDRLRPSEVLSEDAGRSPVEASPAPDDQALMAALAQLMQQQRLYCDGELTLQRLARKLGRSPRQVSQAVNRVSGCHVSQYINRLRIAEACRLLSKTTMPVTEVQLASGFLTKSNFNHEFARQTGMSPSAWRRQASLSAGPAAEMR